MSQRRGVWIPVSQLTELLQRGSWLNQKIEPERAGLVRDALARDARTTAKAVKAKSGTKPEAWAYASYLATLCDLAVFVHFFVDKIAWERAGDFKDAFPAAFGPLADRFLLVEPDREIYAETIELTNALRRELSEEGQVDYLESLDSKRTPQKYWEGSLKSALDYIASGASLLNLNAPAEFVDSQGSVERALFYLNLQRVSGAPVRLSATRLELLNNLDIFIPKRIRDQFTAIAPNDEIQQWVASKFVELDAFDGPPIFEMLMREFGAVKKDTSVMDVVAEVREWRDTKLYREWLWKYFRAKAEHDPARVQKLKGEMGAHLDAMTIAGDTRTRRTRLVSYSLSAALLYLPFAISSKLRVWRWRSEDYVGFIGDWFAAGPRPAEDRIV